MSKEQSNFAHNFKRTTAPGVDTRVLRAHRRSIEWKESRDQVVSRRRNVGAMSPVLEAKGAEHNTRETRKTSQRGDVSDKVANRKAQLMKWKEQKDLRKKVEELEKAKKKPFRVVHIEPEVVPFKTFALKLPQVTAVSDTNTASARLPSTRSKTVGAEAQHDVPASRNTRSKVAPAAASSSAGPRNTRETRSKSSSAAPQTGIARKAQKKADPEPKIPDKAKVPTKAANAKLSTGIGKMELKATAAPERATRSRTRSTVVSGVKAAAPGQIHSASCSEDVPKVCDFSYSRMKKVNLNRGSESSFAPADFRFTAPENVKPFSFNKLNSSNETSDVEKKMTMIEISTDEASFSSGGGTSAAKRQTRKSTKITSTPRVPEIQEECLRTPAVSAVPSGVLTIVPASDCVVLVQKLQGPIASEPSEDVGPVFSMMQDVNKKSRRKSRHSLSSSPVDENRNGDRSRSSLRHPAGRMDDNQRDSTSPDAPEKSLRSLKKRKSKGVATRSVLGQLADSNDVGFVTRKSLEKMGAGSVASKETAARNRRSTAAKEVTKRSEESGRKSASQSDVVPAALKTPEEEPKSESVVKKSGRRERRSVVPKTDVAIATESSKRRSVVKLISSTSFSDSDVEPAGKTATGAKEEYLAAAVEEGKTHERRMGARRSIQGKLSPGGSISNNDGAAQMDKIPEGKLESEPADENEPKKMKASKNSKRKSLRSLTFASSSIDTNSLPVAAEVLTEITETSFKASPEMVTGSGSQRAEETGRKMKENKVQNTSPDVFRTPSQPIRTMRSRSIAVGLDSLKRKTPKNVRNSLILRTLSPEEGVEVLKNSPMIELNRRKLKTPPTGSRIGNLMVPVAPMPNFDDIDFDTDLSKDGSSADRPRDVLSSFDTSTAVVSSSSSVEPLVADEPPVPEDHPIKEKVASPAGKDMDGVTRFRCLLSSETDRLRALCLVWKEVLISDAEQLNEDVSGQIRTTIGQAELLMGQRFRQFSGLVDDCEFKTSEKEVTCTDLQGFWDMIFYQVEDVDKKFSDLDKLKAANWVVENVSKPVKPKATRKKVGEGTKTTVTTKKTTTRPNFAQFRQKLQQQQEQEAETKVIGTILAASPNSEVKTFDGGFFKVDSPVQKKTRASTEKRSSLLEVGNTPKATSVARVVLQRMTRKSLIQSIQDCEQNPTVPSSETNVKHTSPSQSEQRPILPDEEQQMTSVNRNKQNEKPRRSTRKSVYFSEVVTDCDTSPSNFSKYLMPSSDSVTSTPNVSCQPEDKSLLASAKAENTPLANVEMDEVPVKGFKGLKLGFTPGVDGKSRRISSFTPLPNVEKANGMSRINEKSEVIADLMSFSPLPCTAASNESSGESGRKAQVQRRCSTRRSIANKSRMSLL